MDGYRVPLTETRRLRRIARRFEKGERVGLSGLWGSSPALLVSLLARFTGEVLIAVAPDEQEAAVFREDLEFFLGSEVPLCPAYDPRSTSERDARLAGSERLALLGRVLSPTPPRAVVLPASALLDPVPSERDLKKAALRLEPGMQIDPRALCDTLAGAGFESTPMISRPGEYSARGGILDIFPMGSSRPLRIEFFDDEVESMRDFDLETQRSVALRDRVDLLLQARGSKEKKGERRSLASHFPRSALVFVVEPEKTADRLRVYSRELKISKRISAAALSFLNDRAGCDLLALAGGENEEAYRILSARGISRTLPGGDSGRDENRMTQEGGAIDLAASIRAFRERCGDLHILCQVEAEADRLGSVLKEEGIRTDQSLSIQVGRVSEGFQFPAFGLCVINHHELFRRLPVRRPRRTSAVRSRALESFQELKQGDLVVHMVHGIGRYEGLTRMKRESGGEEDFLVLLFRDDVVLYVPASKIHLVHRYVGSGAAAPRLDRIGAASWSRRKERVEGALRDLAGELLETQVARSKEVGFAFAADDDLQRLFDASFPYQDTEDQIESMTLIKTDMERPRPMDRLLCGDVGFGKTELAVRAAFKAASSGKQTALLVPTTLLAQQHYDTFRARLSDYPVTVAVLSRFQKRSRQEEIVRDTRSGRVDILIGTHRILSPDVGFRDLGLLIIDEEQRFGVRHKERLKKIKRTVGVLTMTATPIPRTLHMALVGIRDISSLETPPEGRMPVHTTVEIRSDALIRRALLLEANRGGQVFFLHNRVGSIERQTAKLRELAPKLRIAYAHGQMPEGRLKKVMTGFAAREFDALVCTTIIESGIDMPSVNTILIDRADTFGLADLHQLRGRVGRGHVKAYCTLLIPHRNVSSIALRRLKAIEELSHLGAGFNISLKDLEIRGAGNILGVEQHGHITAIGYDLYCRLLKATVLALKGKKGCEASPVDVDVDLDVQIRAFLPVAYIPDEGIRVEILRRLSECPTIEGIAEMREELADRFGPPPADVERLLDVFRLRRRLLACGIRRLRRARGSREIIVELFRGELFEKEQPFRLDKLHVLAPTRIVLFLPPGVTEPDRVLAYLKSRLMKKGKA